MRAGDWDLVAEFDGEPNGMKFLSDGELLITDYKNGLVALEIASGKGPPVLERRNSERFKGVNDLVFDSRGNLYFTDQGQTGLHDPTGRVYRLRAGRQARRVDHECAEPERRRAVAGREGALRRHDAREQRVAGPAARRRLGEQGRPVLHFVRPERPRRARDGRAGRLVVANPGLGWAWVLNHRAEPVEILRGPAGSSITNVAYGGAGNRTLYLTDSSSGTIRARRCRSRDAHCSSAG